ncbi:Protein of uncharacterised function (DUF2580) [Mycolicibacterium fortuitum]|uniref:Protein of uncharacterized function (DUF2580) n=1 Tax=Mycolicibacterium fortuitum TaxID=1766 RepID=A0A378UU71_MYCFO|nr:Protein of uncharacterised function (DUF2580) [Mycolicibacterium fortuitum]
MGRNGSRGSHHGGDTHNRSDSGDHHSRDRGSNRGSDDGGGDGPLSKISDIKDAVEGVGDIVEDVKSILEGDPMGVVGLVSDGAQLAQMFMPAAFATPIIEGGLMALNGISKTLGFGSPDGGEDFHDGATSLQSTGRGLEQAYPSSWEGTSSSAYSGQNSKQIDRTSTMISADNKVISILQTEAKQVADTRDNMDNIATYLGAAIAPAMALMAIPIGGEPASLAFQAAAVGAASGVAGVTMGQMVSNAMSNSSQLQQAIAQYQQVSSAAKLGGGSMSGPPSMPGTGNPNTSGNGDSPTGSSPGEGAPSGGTPSGGGGTPSGGGGGTPSSGGGGAASGGGTPSSSGAGATPSTSASSPSGASGGASGSAAGGGAGMLGSLGSLLGQVVQAATQAAGQAQQAATQAATQAAGLAQQAAGQGQEGDPTAAGEEVQTVGREEPAAEQEGAAGAGSEAPGERAPIHIAVDFDSERRVELDVQPDQVKGPIHVSLDPANPTAPPRITREV